jgi:hypothetical protein
MIVQNIILFFFFFHHWITAINLQNKKLITISPGGFKGFYMLGLCSYIKQKYPLHHYVFSGASAGAWNALFMVYKGEPIAFLKNIMDELIKELHSPMEIKTKIKEKLLSSYNDSDFHLDRILVSVSSMEHYQLKPVIYSNFDNLEEAIDWCIASSNIPFITGSIMNKYHDIYSFDGGFSKHPFSSIENIKPVLHITPDIWEKKKKSFFQRTSFFMISEYLSLLSLDNYDLKQLYNQGYTDAEKNKDTLDSLLSG